MIKRRREERREGGREGGRGKETYLDDGGNSEDKLGHHQ